ncbi:MAG TPA: hypothetical protein VLN45_02365 [Ignavibacteriaceae bacterium]|nr:hypothetical protein [Ignavibacteriaceae bacterium]
MTNVLSIIIMFLIAAINTLVVVIAVHLIFKIRTRRGTKENQLKKVESIEMLKEEIPVDIKQKNIPEEISIKPKIEDEKKEFEIKERVKPKFLKYTTKGYIDAEKDVNKQKHTWR